MGFCLFFCKTVLFRIPEVEGVRRPEEDLSKNGIMMAVNSGRAGRVLGRGRGRWFYLEMVGRIIAGFL